MSRQEESESPSSIRAHTDDKQRPEDPSGTSTKAFDTLLRYLQSEDMSFIRHKQSTILTHLTGKNASYRMIMDMQEERDPDDHIFLLYVTCPVKAPAETRLAVAEYMTRVNWLAVIGNFEMDMTDGEIRYKGVIEYADGAITNSMLEQLIHKCAGTMDLHFPGLMRIIYGNVDAVTALQPVIAVSELDPLTCALAQLVEEVDVNDESDGNNSAAAAASPLGRVAEPGVMENDEEEGGQLDFSSSTDEGMHDNEVDPANE